MKPFTPSDGVLHISQSARPKAKKTKRYKPAIRKDQAVAVALQIAKDSHYLQVRRTEVAERIGVSPPALSYHFGSMAGLREEIIRAAIREEELGVLLQGLAANDEEAEKAPAALRERAFRYGRGV